MVYAQSIGFFFNRDCPFFNKFKVTPPNDKGKVDDITCLELVTKKPEPKLIQDFGYLGLAVLCFVIQL